MQTTHVSQDFDVPPEYALLTVDMKSYSQLPEAKMSVVRSDLDGILETVFAQSGLPNPQSLGRGHKDAGDGAILVLPSRHTARLVDPLLGHLHEALARYDKIRLACAPPLLLRASVHVGPLTPTDHRGDAINDACRLVESDGARQALAAAMDNGSFLGVAVSELVFHRTVRAGRTPHLTERQFLKATARVEDKPGFEETCWILVPGMAPAEISSYLAAEHDQPAPQPQSPVTQEDRERQETGGRQSGVKQKGKASGKARLVQVGGNYITGPERS